MLDAPTTISVAIVFCFSTACYTLTLDSQREYEPWVDRPKDNRQQIEEYLSLAGQVHVSRLQYPRKFTALDEAFSLIQNDLLSDETE